MTCRSLGRTFEGHGIYSIQTYQADFAEGQVVTLFVHPSDLVAVGDRRSLESMVGQGYVARFLRLVANPNEVGRLGRGIGVIRRSG